MLKPFLFALFCGLTLSGGAGAASISGAVSLTPVEQAYVAQSGPVTLCVDPDWAPFERLNERGEHVGIAADLLKLVSERVGLRFQVVLTRSWAESLQASRSGLCRAMSFLNQTPARDDWLLFTEPVFVDPNVIITREEHPFIADLKGLDGQSVAVPAGTMVEERLRRDYPGLKVIATASEAESVSLVEARQADMAVRTLIGVAYTIKKEGLFNLKIAGQLPDYTNQLRIGVRREDPLLREVLNKGVATLMPQEREAIWNRHVSIQVQQGIDYSLVWRVLLGAGLLLAVSVTWIRKLRHLNRELARLSVTDRLTGLYNRLRLDEALEAELQRGERYDHGFSVILIDVDHFKLVNDNHGHPVGDQVLVTLAGVLQANTRGTDVVGRWGGEEFMVICPHTDHAGVLILAENLRRAVARAPFPVVGTMTVSLGVSSFNAGDHSNDLVARADAALYEAKALGRNRVEARFVPC